MDNNLKKVLPSANFGNKKKSDFFTRENQVINFFFLQKLEYGLSKTCFLNYCPIVKVTLKKIEPN